MVNPTTTVTQGTLIPAILETAIDTNVPGYVRAVVSQDVRSFDGTKVLVPRSSRLIGQYQSGLQNGQRRAYVIWTRLIRPDGASVNLASPAVGFDGTTGLAAWDSTASGRFINNVVTGNGWSSDEWVGKKTGVWMNSDGFEFAYNNVWDNEMAFD